MRNHRGVLITRSVFNAVSTNYKRPSVSTETENYISSANFILNMSEHRPERGSILDELLEFAVWGLVGLMVAWFSWTLSAGLIERLFLFDSSLIGQLLNVGSIAVLTAVVVSIILFGVARPVEERLTAFLK